MTIRFRLFLLALLALLLAATLPVCALTSVHAGDRPAEASLAAPRGEICFPPADAEAILHEVEAGRAAIAEADACRAWQADHALTDQAREKVCEATAERLEEVTRERDQAFAQAAANVEAGEDAAAAAGGSWWSRIKTRVTWAGIGAAALAIVVVVL